MTSNHRRAVAGTRHRILSDWMNRALALSDRLTVDMARALCGIEDDRSGIIHGCTVNVVFATMNFEVDVGIGLYFDPASGLPDSKYRLISIESPLQGTFDTADAQDRWDLVEIAPGDVPTAPQNNDIWQPALGSFATSPTSTERVPQPVINIVKGVAGASPKFPTPTPGYIPIAYQYVPGSAAFVVGDDTLHCRPILRPISQIFDPQNLTLMGYRPSELCSGGGINAGGGAGVLTGSVAVTMEGFFSRSHTPFRVLNNSVVGIGFGTHDGGGLPALNSVQYIYAVIPPLLAPMGDPQKLAPREFYIRNSNRIQSSGYSDGLQGCIYVSSPEPPELSPQGPPAVGGVGTFIGHPTFGSFNSNRMEWYYIGACFYASATSEVVFQRCDGRRVHTRRKPGALLTPAIPIVVATNIVVTATYPGGDAIAWPHTIIQEMDISISDAPNPGNDTRVVFRDTVDPVLAAPGRRVFANTYGGALIVGDATMEYTVFPGQFMGGAGVTVDYADTAAAAVPVAIRGRSYVDGVLSRR
jgi:hypothetical protein